MARTREFSRKRPKKDNGAYLSNKFHAVHNNNNIKSVDQEKNRRDLDLSDNNNTNANDNDEMNRHVHHDINITMIGRKFQYVTRSGERKNYTILSYDSTNATHRVRRVKIIEEEKGEEKKYGQYHDHKTKDISMEGLPNIRWLDVAVPEGHLKVTYLYSSRYIGVQYTMGDNGCPSWKAFAPKLKAGTGRKKYVGTYRTERDAALAHDCYAREIGCSKLNFQDEFIYKEEATTLQMPPSSSASSVASLSSCDTSVVPEPNNDNCDGKKQVSRSLQQELPTTTTTTPTTTKEDDTNLSKMKKISKYRGVSHFGQGLKSWRTQIAMKSVMTSLGKYKGSGRPGTHVVGNFEDEIEAALAYDEVLRKHGTISEVNHYLNFPNQNKITIVEVADDEKSHSSVTKQNINSPSDHGGKQKEKKRKREEEKQISQKKSKNNKNEKKINGKNNSIKKKDNNNNEDDSSSMNNRKRSMNVANNIDNDNNKMKKENYNINKDDSSSTSAKNKGNNNNKSTKKKEINKSINKKDNTKKEDDSSSASANNYSNNKSTKKKEKNKSIKKKDNNNKKGDSSSVSTNNDGKKKENKNNNSITNKSINNKDDDSSSSSANNDGNNENKKKKKNENNNNINANNDGNKKKENKKKNENNNTINANNDGNKKKENKKKNKNNNSIKNKSTNNKEDDSISSSANNDSNNENKKKNANNDGNKKENNKKNKNKNSIKNKGTNNREDDSSSSIANSDDKNKKKKKNGKNTSIKKKNNNNIEDNNSTNNDNRLLNVANNDDDIKNKNKKKKNNNNIKKKDSSSDNGINKIKNIADDNETTTIVVANENIKDDSSSNNHSNNSINNKKMNDKASLLGLVVGDRIAFDFGSGIYFGSIDECDTFKKVKSAWNWNVTFDDGDRYKFDYKDMLEGVTLYEKIKMDEMNDPNREKKVMKIKDNFFTQQKIVLSKIPEIVEKQFLQVGFALWQKIYLPVMYLGPYDVSPGPVRDEWLAAFEKCEKSKVPQLVYWFGNNSNGAFSVLELTSCLSFEEGKRRGLLEQKRGATDKNRFDKALVQLKEVLKKPLHKRVPFVKLKEEHEHLCGPQADRLLVELE